MKTATIINKQDGTITKLFDQQFCKNFNLYQREKWYLQELKDVEFVPNII